MASCPKDLAGGQPSTSMGLLAKKVIREFKLVLNPLCVEVYPSERLAGRENLRYVRQLYATLTRGNK
jgi:hypothetical protein